MCTYLKNMEGKKLKVLKNKSFDSIQKMFAEFQEDEINLLTSKQTLWEGSSKELLLEDKTRRAYNKGIMEVMPDEVRIACRDLEAAFEYPGESYDGVGVNKSG
ncbi:hypothetical protein Tco_0711384 [Tanacetum coccineum]